MYIYVWGFWDTPHTCTHTHIYSIYLFPLLTASLSLCHLVRVLISHWYLQFWSNTTRFILSIFLSLFVTLVNIIFPQIVLVLDIGYAFSWLLRPFEVPPSFCFLSTSFLLYSLLLVSPQPWNHPFLQRTLVLFLLENSIRMQNLDTGCTLYFNAVEIWRWITAVAIPVQTQFMWAISLWQQDMPLQAFTTVEGYTESRSLADLGGRGS